MMTAHPANGVSFIARDIFNSSKSVEKKVIQDTQYGG
jgi:hypothetical protein